DSSNFLQHDFGPKVHEGPIHQRNTARQSFVACNSKNQRMDTTLIAYLQSHSALTGLAVSPGPDRAFFVLCSDDMSVKV
ncbi:uncharacterized protein F5891DRAFT_1224621, partial [Suillus fuscotomentosus]